MRFPCSTLVASKLTVTYSLASVAGIAARRGQSAAAVSARNRAEAAWRAQGGRGEWRGDLNETLRRLWDLVRSRIPAGM